MNNLSITALLSTIIALLIGLAWVAVLEGIEAHRMAKRQRDRLPKATRYSKEVDRLLELDEHEKSISN